MPVMNGLGKTEMLATLDTQLEGLGVALAADRSGEAFKSSDQATATLVRGGSQQTYALALGPSVSMTTAARSKDDRPSLVFTTYVSPRTADAFRRAGVQYLDTAGNAWVHFGDVLIDVRGRPRPDRTTARRRASGNLFSSGRAQVIFALLAWPRLWDASRRDVARAAGVSLGQAHNTLALLADAGYGSTRTRPGQTALLELWAAAFPTGLAQRLTLAAYRGDITSVRAGNEDDPLFVSGASAAPDLLRPASLTIYVEKLDPHLPVVNRWRADGEPNIIVRRMFWKDPDDADVPTPGHHVAPWPLVYADLQSSDDPRVRGAAQEWRDQHAGLQHHT